MMNGFILQENTSILISRNGKNIVQHFTQESGLDLKDQETIDSFALSQETFTGGVTPAATSNDKHYKLNVTYKDKAETFTGGFPVYEGNKPVLTLKELDFRIRQTLIKSKKLYNNSYNKGQIKITGTDNNYTIDLSKRLPSTDANRYVKKPQNAKIEVILEKSN